MSHSPSGLGVATAALAALAPLVLGGSGMQEVLELEPRMRHFGNDRTPSWSEAPAEPERPPLVVEFDSSANDREWVLELTARDVDETWTIELGGTVLGTVKRHNEALLTSRYVVPPGAVVSGRNVLRVVASHPDEDITLGKIRLHRRTLREVLDLGRIDVTVRDSATRRPMPARVTVADEEGRLVELFYAEASTTAVRNGVTYTANGAAAVELPAGRYQIWATRGMEWSCDRAEVTVRANAKSAVELALTREVDTAGWIAADTHVHTFTHSGHGDASVEERVVTLAGEGVELAVATDHNHQTDYRPVQQQLELTEWFTPVVGNEVTSDNGHMNAFPLPPGKDVPVFKEKDWSKLVAGIRAKGAKVVILNHPRWPEEGRDPLTSFGFDDRSGERTALPIQRFTFDCLELVNSDSPTQPPERVLPGWYGLLNRGERLTGVGASDSHAVGVIVGQGRTYVPSRTDDPAKIDVDDACRQFQEGRVSVSLGMLATIAIEGRGMGDVLEVASGRDEIEVDVEVRHPSWVTPESIELVVDGMVLARTSLAPIEGGAPGDGACSKARRLRVRLPRHDAWIVAVVSGAKVTAPFWAMQLPRALAVTNPVFLDHDGIQGWSSPRATAERLLAGESARSGEKTPPLRERVAAGLARVDDGVAIQLLELARDELRIAAQAGLEELAGSAGAERPLLGEWARAQRPQH